MVADGGRGIWCVLLDSSKPINLKLFRAIGCVITKNYSDRGHVNYFVNFIEKRVLFHFHSSNFVPMISEFDVWYNLKICVCIVYMLPLPLPLLFTIIFAAPNSTIHTDTISRSLFCSRTLSLCDISVLSVQFTCKYPQHPIFKYSTLPIHYHLALALSL